MGRLPQIKVFDGMTGQLTRSYLGFEKTFLGGVYVAAGDVNGDGLADIIVGRDTGKPQVRVFSGADGSLLSSFFAYPGFNGGVRVAVGDVNGDGIPDIITGAGKGPAQPLRAFDGQSLAALDSFFALDPRTSKGLFVAGSR